jgi:DNA-binding MarR family transcriptional regulator
MRHHTTIDKVNINEYTDERLAKLVTYTDYGLEVARAGRRHIVALERRLAEEFGEAEYARVLEVLARITDVVEANDEF